MIAFTVSLNDASLLPSHDQSTFDSVSSHCDVPHSRGILVSADMTIPMVSAAHSCPDTFHAILSLMGCDA